MERLFWRLGPRLGIEIFRQAVGGAWAIQLLQLMQIWHGDFVQFVGAAARMVSVSTCLKTGMIIRARESLSSLDFLQTGMRQFGFGRVRKLRHQRL